MTYKIIPVFRSRLLRIIQRIKTLDRTFTHVSMEALLKYHKTSAFINTNRHTTNRFPNVDHVLDIFVPGDSIVMSIYLHDLQPK